MLTDVGGTICSEVSFSGAQITEVGQAERRRLICRLSTHTLHQTHNTHKTTRQPHQQSLCAVSFYSGLSHLLTQRRRGLHTRLQPATRW